LTFCVMIAQHKFQLLNGIEDISSVLKMLSFVMLYFKVLAFITVKVKIEV